MDNLRKFIVVRKTALLVKIGVAVIAAAIVLLSLTK